MSVCIDLLCMSPVGYISALKVELYEFGFTGSATNFSEGTVIVLHYGLISLCVS